MAKFPSASQHDFSPGVYIITGANDSVSDIISTFDAWVRGNPYIRGIVVKQKWGYSTSKSPAMEGDTSGDYNFAFLQAVLDHVGQYPGKFVVFWPSYKLFTSAGQETPAIVPLYLRTSQYGGGAYTNTSGTSTARIWRQDVCDEFDRVLRAFGAQFGGSPVLNGVHLSETAPGSGATGQSDWPADPGYTNRYIQLAKAIAEAFPLASCCGTPNFTLDRDAFIAATKVAPWYVGTACPDSIPFKSSLVGIHDAIRSVAGTVITAPHIEFGNTGQAIQYPMDYPLYSQYPGSHVPDVYECLYYCAYYLKGNYIFLQLSQENGQTAASMIAAVNQLGDAGILPVVPPGVGASGFIPGQIRETASAATVDLNDAQTTEVEFVNQFVDTAAPSAPTIDLGISGRYFVEATSGN